MKMKIKSAVSKKRKNSSGKNLASEYKPYIIGGIVLVALVIIVFFLTTPIGEAIRTRGLVTPRVSTQNIQSLVENCRNGVDDNRDGKIDGRDPQCRGRQCAASDLRVWTWSRQPGDAGYEDNSGSAPVLGVTCCYTGQCADDGECIDYDQPLNTRSTQNPAMICGDNVQWDRCYDTRSAAPMTNSEGRQLYTHYPFEGRDTSDGGSYRCQNGVWLSIG